MIEQPPTVTANDKQIGGSHYKSVTDGMPEHWDVVTYMGWDYFVGAATKYIWRLGKKDKSPHGQLQDVEKAIHYLEKKCELLRIERDKMDRVSPQLKQPPNMTSFSNPLDNSDIDSDDIYKG